MRELSSENVEFIPECSPKVFQTLGHSTQVLSCEAKKFDTGVGKKTEKTSVYRDVSTNQLAMKDIKAM